MVEKKDANGVPALEFTMGSSRYLIAPEEGFRLMKWTLSAATGTREILHWPESPEKASFARARGGNPLLFPFSGRSFDRGIEGSWRAPDGERRPMPMHGFARDSKFDIILQNDQQVSAVLQPSEEAMEAYPYDYRFTATYKFDELAFSIRLNLENLGDKPIPWSAGHHFYFNLPWHQGARRGDYHLNMEARKCAYRGLEGKLAMQQNRETCHDLSDTALLDRIHWQLRHNRVSFGPKGGEEDIHVIIGTDPVPQKVYSIVTWSESEEAPYYCIEPWMGPPNAAEHGKGLHWVGAGEEQSFDVEVSLY